MQHSMITALTEEEELLPSSNKMLPTCLDLGFTNRTCLSEQGGRPREYWFKY